MHGDDQTRTAQLLPLVRAYVHVIERLDTDGEKLFVEVKGVRIISIRNFGGEDEMNRCL